MTAVRRELLVVVVLDLVGAVMVLLSVSRTWAHAVVAVSGSPQAPQTADLAGRSVAPLVAALGMVALAAVIALLATRGWWRVVVGAVLAVVGALIIGSTALTSATDVRHGSALRDKVSTAVLRDARSSVELRPWRHVAAAGGLLVVAAGLLAAARGRSWSGMGRRFDAPTAAPSPAPVAAEAPSQVDLWDQLERGQDPTA
ncbi:MAG: Trp biosynthesis-associated membrane protein [Actinomycetes bacterium]